MSVESPKNLVPKFFENTAKSYDKVVFWATFGRDNYWKNEILKRIPKGDLCLDLACGTGILTRKIAEKFPNTKVIGIDITESYLEKAKSCSKKYPNISFIHQDAEKLNLGMKFDCITSSYIPKYCDAEILVKNCKDHLKPGGKIILHDFVYPKNFVRKLWNAYFVLLNFIGFLIPSWKAALSELPKLIRSTNWLKDYEKVLQRNGFEVSYNYLTLNSSAILLATKKI